MKRKLIAVLVANLFVVPLASAQGLDWSGSSASIGLRVVEDSADDPSKLNEYRDLDDSALVGFEARGRGSQYYLNAFGENLGKDDQYLDLKGGRYGVFKYQLYSNELRHRFGSGLGARSPYAGIGTANLTDPAGLLGTTNVAAWNFFDHSYKRRDTGGMFEWQATSPWYFRVDANEVKREGINVFAGALGTSPGQGMTDLPAPIDYTTYNTVAEAGYSGDRSHFAVSVTYSKFENENERLNWFQLGANPGGGVPAGTDTTTLAPDNELIRIAVNGNVRGLPGRSTLAGRFTYSKLTSDTAVPAANLWGSTGIAGGTVFDGKIDNMTASLSYSSQPMDKLDTRIYWNWIDDKNKSTDLNFNAATGGLTGCVPLCIPHKFEYEKWNLGGEAGYRVNRENRVRGGLDYTDVKRERVDFHGDEEWKAYAEWKNFSFDNVTARVKYQHMQRRSDWIFPSAAAIAANPLEPFMRRFDLADRDQHLVKVGLDFAPAPMVDVGIEAIWKRNNYKNVVLGRTDDERKELYASVAFGDPKKFRVLIFGDIEFLEYNSSHRVGFPATPPSTPPTPTAYNWTASNDDKAWQVGIGMDWIPRERLKVAGSLTYAETHGTADFAIQPGGSTTAGQQPIDNFDNTERWALNLKGVYEVDKHWEITGGYAFEKYDYSDIGYDNTQYVITSGNPARFSYFTGQFSFQDYTAHIFYLVGKYKF